MLSGYYTTYYAEVSYGPGYILTGAILALGSAWLLWKKKGSRIRSDLLQILGVAAIVWLAGFVFDSLFYGILQADTLMDDFRLILMLVVSGALQKGWSVWTRLLRGSVFFACMQLALPISEPFGDLVKSVNESYSWGSGITPAIMGVLCVATVLYLRHFSTEAFTALPSALNSVIVVISLMAWGVWRLCRVFDAGRAFSFILAVLLWIQIWLFYYVFYIAGQEMQKNMELQAIQQKSELDRELLDLTRQTYDDLHKTRHELKNHLIYMKVLAYKEEWDKLWNYLNALSSEAEQMFTYVECGNEVVNAVLNHAVGKARQQGIQVETSLVVPPSLPYDEVDLCSLLSNLANNAIEAAAQVVENKQNKANGIATRRSTAVQVGKSDFPESGSGGRDQTGTAQEKGLTGPIPTIRFSIYPQQDYLFIKVENPFAPSVSRERRLSLQTTKKDARYHGYGTKVIRQIAEKYNGSASFTIEGDQFIATVMLDLGSDR